MTTTITDTENTTTIALDDEEKNTSTSITPKAQDIPTFLWSDVMPGGKGNKYYTGGILRTGLTPQMTTPDGLTKLVESEKNGNWYITYDINYVCYRFAELVGQLGVFADNTVNKEAVDWVINRFIEYLPNYAILRGNSSSGSLVQQAKALSKSYPHISQDQWLIKLQEIAKTSVVSQEEKTSDAENKKTSAGRAKKQ
jgi:hypothetical protein